MNDIIESLGGRNADGNGILRQAILHGLVVKVMPGQLFLFEEESGRGKTAFVHSVAMSTRLSTITFVLQKRFRRAIHQRKGVPVPKGATFSYFAKKDPIRYAKKVGYPVVVKELFGENPAFSIKNINNSKELFAAVKMVQEHLPTSGVIEPSSYAQTINLSAAESGEDGKRKKSGKARYLIEKQLFGEHYRSYVIDGQHVHSLLITDTGSHSVEAPTEIQALAEKAVISISGMRNGTVDIIDDKSEGAAVIDVSERMFVPEDCQGNILINEKIHSELFLAEAKASGVRLRKRRESAAYEVIFKGVTSSEGLISSLDRAVKHDRGSLNIQADDKVKGEVVVEVKSTARLIVGVVDYVFRNFHLSSLEVRRKKWGVGRFFLV